MTTPRRLLRALAAAAAATMLAAGPVWATEAEEPTPEATAEEAPAEGEAGEEEHEAGSDKIELPLGFESPYELVGWGLLALTGLAGAAALATAYKQLKGRRPQADGSWRPR